MPSTLFIHYSEPLVQWNLFSAMLASSEKLWGVRVGGGGGGGLYICIVWDRLHWLFSIGYPCVVLQSFVIKIHVE